MNAQELDFLIQEGEGLRVEFVENMGTGINKIQRLLRESNCSPASFEFNTFFTVVFSRAPEKQVASDNKTINKTGRKTINKTINKTGRKTGRKTGKKTKDRILELLTTSPDLTAKEVSQSLGLKAATVRWHIKTLKAQGMLRRMGPDNGGHWEVQAPQQEREP